jgi:hypothetical protein
MTRYYREETLQAVALEGKYYIRNRESGDLVRVDSALYGVWTALWGQTRAVLLEALDPGTWTPALLQAALDVLVCARLVRTDEAETGTHALRKPPAGPLVSVVVLNMDGMAHLETCFSSLLAQTYENIEVILADNGSSDGSVEYVRECYPTVRVVALGVRCSERRVSVCAQQRYRGRTRLHRRDGPCHRA